MHFHLVIKRLGNVFSLKKVFHTKNNVRSSEDLIHNNFGEKHIIHFMCLPIVFTIIIIRRHT